MDKEKAENQKLRLLGKVAPAVLAKLNIATEGTGQQWLFVDYAPCDFPLYSNFDILIEDSNTNWSYSTAIHLLSVTDQFGRIADNLPKGWKTICLFGFIPGIPAAIRNLPECSTWKLTQESIHICNSRDMDLRVPLSVQSMDFEILSYLLLNELHRDNRFIFHLDDIEGYGLHNPSHLHYLIRNMILAGKVKERNANEYELINTK